MDIEHLKREHEAMKIVLTLIASGAIQDDNCRAIANTTLNELYCTRDRATDAE